MVPYLKGIHLTLDGWRPNRDEEGWKRSSNQDEDGGSSIGCDYWEGNEESLEVPKIVRAVPRLVKDVGAILLLSRQEHPPLRRVRSKRVINVYYRFGDASAVGFCSTFQRFTKEGKEFVEIEKIDYKYGH